MRRAASRRAKPGGGGTLTNGSTVGHHELHQRGSAMMLEWSRLLQQMRRRHNPTWLGCPCPSGRGPGAVDPGPALIHKLLLHPIYYAQLRPATPLPRVPAAVQSRRPTPQDGGASAARYCCSSAPRHAGAGARLVRDQCRPTPEPRKGCPARPACSRASRAPSPPGARGPGPGAARPVR